jgi:hypothetical protein
MHTLASRATALSDQTRSNLVAFFRGNGCLNSALSRRLGWGGAQHLGNGERRTSNRRARQSARLADAGTCLEVRRVPLYAEGAVAGCGF